MPSPAVGLPIHWEFQRNWAIRLACALSPAPGRGGGRLEAAGPVPGGGSVVAWCALVTRAPPWASPRRRGRVASLGPGGRRAARRQGGTGVALGPPTAPTQADTWCTW